MKIQRIEIKSNTNIIRYNEKQIIIFTIKAYEEQIKVENFSNLIKYFLKVGNNYLRKPT